jgi:ubiquinol oxidase
MSLITNIVNKIVLILVNSLVKIMDFLFPDPYRHFFVLETVARIPYFSYLSVLHLYQSLGKHPSLELLDLHYKETVNEEYHLLIMEELGGNKNWFDRLIARFIGVVYYWFMVILYLIFPSSGYFMMEQIEAHATKSYTKFLKSEGEALKNQKAGKIALRYYFSEKARMTSNQESSNQDISLYEIFKSIRDDEIEHCKKMNFCSNMSSLYSQNPGIELEN